MWSTQKKVKLKMTNERETNKKKTNKITSTKSDGYLHTKELNAVCSFDWKLRILFYCILSFFSVVHSFRDSSEKSEQKTTHFCCFHRRCWCSRCAGIAGLFSLFLSHSFVHSIWFFFYFVVFIQAFFVENNIKEEKRDWKVWKWNEHIFLISFYSSAVWLMLCSVKCI